jgi:hypothetical protein
LKEALAATRCGLAIRNEKAQDLKRRFTGARLLPARIERSVSARRQKPDAASSASQEKATAEADAATTQVEWGTRAKVHAAARQTAN